MPVENDEDFEDYDMDESLNDPQTSGAVVEKSLKHHTPNVQENLQRELTEKYISGIDH